jgi:RNA polymerase sigma-70 factor, ECF subfamily
MSPRAQTSPDAELIRGFLEGGDQECFAELFMRHRKNIYFSCRRFFSEQRAAEDATQETFLRAYRNMRSFQGGDFSSWLMRIARNICIDEYRKTRPEVPIGDAELAEIPGSASAAPLDAQLMANRIRLEIKSLSPEQRQCLEMKIEGYSYEETSARTGFSVEAVKSYIQNGRRMLWRRMEGALPQPK